MRAQLRKTGASNRQTLTMTVVSRICLCVLFWQAPATEHLQLIAAEEITAEAVANDDVSDVRPQISQGKKIRRSGLEGMLAAKPPVRVAAPAPDPAFTGNKGRRGNEATPADGNGENDNVAKREDLLLSNQIELERLLKYLGTDHPKVQELKDRIRITQDWLEKKKKDPNRTLVISVPGRDPKEIAKILTELYGEKVKIATDESTGSVLVRIVTDLNNRIPPNSLHLLAEIEAMAVKLQPRVEIPAVTAALATDPIARVPQPAARVFASDEEDVKLDQEAKQLAAQLRDAEPEAKEPLRKKLEEVTERQFEYRQKRRLEEFESLSQRVEQLKKTHARRQANKAEVIQRRVNELLDPNADLNWEGAGAMEEMKIGKGNTANQRNASIGESKPATDSVVEVQRASPGDNLEPTYNGMTLTEALRLVKTDRNRESVPVAILAMNHLMDQGDPREMARAVLQMMRFHGTDYLDYTNSVIMNGSGILLWKLPCEIVVEELINELPSAVSRKATRDFYLYFLRSLLSSHGVTSIHSKDFKTQLLTVDALQMADSVEQLNREIRRKSRRLIGALLDIAKQDDRLTLWAGMSVVQIVNISKQQITTYLEAVPLVERVFAITTTFGTADHRLDAAILLGKSGVAISDVFEFAEQRMKDPNPSLFQNPVNCFVAIAPHSPEAVNRLNELLDDKWTELTAQLAIKGEYEKQSKKQNEDSEPVVLPPAPDDQLITNLTNQTVISINALIRVGLPAKDSIPLLRKIAASANSVAVATYTRNPSLGGLAGIGSGGGGMGGGTPVTFKDISTKAIQQIEEAKPLSIPDPLPDDGPN